MKYAQIHKGTVFYVYDAKPVFSPKIRIVECSDEVTQGWTYEGGVFTPPVPEPEPDYGWKITKLAMRNRFTKAEKIAIETAAETSVEIRVFKDDLAAAKYIDLERSDTIADVTSLETMGLIGAGRANEILTTPVTYEEKY